MGRQVLSCIALVLLVLVGAAGAGPKTETFELTTFAPPAGWQRAPAKASSIGFVKVSEAAGAAGSITIERSLPSTGDARANFDSAWKEIVTLPNVPAPTVAAATKRDGWDVVRGTAKYTYGGRAASTTILTATRDATYVIVVVTLVNTTFQKEADALLASLRFGAPPAAPAAASAPARPAPAATATSPTGGLTGAWGFSMGGALWASPMSPWMSDHREYTFDGQGTYTFLRRHDVTNEPETTVTRERGTYTLRGDTLTLTPTKSERETWRKVVDGPNAGAYAKLVRRARNPLEKCAYRVSFETHPDAKHIPALMLAPAAPTAREGEFNDTKRYRYLRPDGTYYTAIKPTP